MLAFLGHELNALVLWQTPFNTSILLPPGHLLKSQEVPDNWFDGESSITGERLLFQSRGVQRQWQVSELPEPLSPTDPLGTGALNLGPSSPIWHSHAAVVFTGAQLHFLPHQTGRLCSAMSALEHVAGSTHHVRYYMNSPRQHTLRVVDRDGTQEEAGSAFFNVSLLWGADLAQSLIPIGASRLLEKYHSMQLELDNRVVLLDSYGMQQVLLSHTSAPITRVMWLYIGEAGGTECPLLFKCVDTHDGVSTACNTDATVGARSSPTG
jgi:hypothetical protein